MKKMASSQASAVCGRRLRGINTTESTRMTKSTTSSTTTTIAANVAPVTMRAGSAVVHELQGDVEVFALEQRLHLLQVVAALRLHAQLVTLDLALHTLRPLVANDLGDRLRVFARDALLDRCLDAILLAARERFAGIQRPQRDAPLDQLLLEDLEHRLHPLLGARLHQDLLAAELERGADVLEVVALLDLLLRLTHRVLHLHLVDLAHDVERGICHAAMLVTGDG